MKSKTVLLVALSLFFVVGILVFNVVKQNNYPPQVKYLNSALGCKMISFDEEKSWQVTEDGISYAIYNIAGERTGQLRTIITIYAEEAGDLSKVKEIITHYFPEQSEVIFSNINDRVEKLTNNWLEGSSFEYTQSSDKEIWVKALDGQRPSVRIEFTLPV